MNQYIENLVATLRRLLSNPGEFQRISSLAGELGGASDADVDVLLNELHGYSREPDWKQLQAGLEPILAGLLQRARKSVAPTMEAHQVTCVREIYDSFDPASRLRCYLLGWLASHRNELPLQAFAEILVEDPPTCPTGIVLAFGPLINGTPFSATALFPKLLEALGHRNVAAAILDLANLLVREGRVETHPAAGRAEQMAKVLGELVNRLNQLELGEAPQGIEAGDLSQAVNDSVALVVSLCDGLSLIGDVQATDVLSKAAELKHRRVRTEALAGLAKLGDQRAGDRLSGLAKEPVVRLRVITYAEELGLEAKIDPRYTTPGARAESELAMWLAQPSQMGLAPTRIAVLDQRSLYWPGFPEPVDCFLLRYEYGFERQPVVNYGLAGPLTHAFASSLLELSVSDAYACFAGWQCVHEEIHEITLERASVEHPGLVERLLAKADTAPAGRALLPDTLTTQLEPVFLGFFMGEAVLVASGHQQEKAGTALIDQDECQWIASPTDEPGSATHELAYCVYKGRRLLAAFNSPDVWPGNPVEQ